MPYCICMDNEFDSRFPAWYPELRPRVAFRSEVLAYKDSVHIYAKSHVRCQHELRVDCFTDRRLAKLLRPPEPRIVVAVYCVTKGGQPRDLPRIQCLVLLLKLSGHNACGEGKNKTSVLFYAV